MTKTIGFKVDCEWLCNFVRQRVYYEGLAFTDGLKQIRASFNCSEEIAFDILTGRKKVVGINEGYLEDDNRYEEYKKYLLREEEKKARRELENDICIHPLDYFDPFAATWSYKQFCERTVDKGIIPTIESMKDWFMQPPCEEESDPFLMGGMWSIDANIAKKIIKSPEDKEEFYKHLYEIVEMWLEDKNLPQAVVRRMRIRQHAYRLYITKEERREKRIQKIMAEGKNLAQEEFEKKGLVKEGKKELPHIDYPHWVIDKETNIYTLFNGSEAYYLRNAKYMPCPDGKFFKYGLISPDGDFYACDFASHKGAAFAIAKQKGIIKVPDEKFFEHAHEEYDGYDEEKAYDSAKDVLYDKGWVFVNTAYGWNAYTDGPFFSKWGKIESMPQKQMNTCFDWEVWWRNQGD